MGNILICLEQLGIGGVETAVANQSIAFKNKGNNVFILAKEGKYTEILEKSGINCINFNYEIENKFDIEKIKTIASIIKQYNIAQVHIHQLACMPNVWAACILNNIPYIFYIHTTVPIEDCNWFEAQYTIYGKILKPFFENASKIVCITKKSVEAHNSKYSNINKQKYIIVPNSINFEQYKSKEDVKQLKNFLIISRISEEKIGQIKRSINLFLNYKKQSGLNDLKLDIVGEGNKKQELKEYIENQKITNVNLLPGTNEVEKTMDKYDAVIGIGRCILEAIAMKKIAILSGFYNLNGIIDENNIQEAMNFNFVGKNMEETHENSLASQICNLNNTPENIQKIIQYNYDFLYKNRNINDNIFYLTDNFNVEYDNVELFNIINLVLEDYEKEKNKSEEIWTGKQWLEDQYLKQKEYIKNLENIIEQNKKHK